MNRPRSGQDSVLQTLLSGLQECLGHDDDVDRLTNKVTEQFDVLRRAYTNHSRQVQGGGEGKDTSTALLDEYKRFKEKREALAATLKERGLPIPWQLKLVVDDMERQLKLREALEKAPEAPSQAPLRNRAEKAEAAVNRAKESNSEKGEELPRRRRVDPAFSREQHIRFTQRTGVLAILTVLFIFFYQESFQ